MRNLNKFEGFNDKITKITKRKGEEKRYSIMLMMVESLSAEYMGVFGDKKGLIPRLGVLTKKSLSFDNFYTIDTRTVRGYENKFIYAGDGYFDNMNDFFLITDLKH